MAWAFGLATVCYMDIHRRIYYVQDDGQIELPDWCYYCLKLGAVMACVSSSDRRLVLALAVPTRAYVAALISTGLVIERLDKETEAGPVEDHIEMLRGLEKGTPVIIHEDTKKIKGILVGVKDNFYGGKPFVGVQVQGPSKKGIEGIGI